MENRRLVVVGESNPFGSDPRYALYHLPRFASGDRLRMHLGLRDSTYEKLEKVNLCDGPWRLDTARLRVNMVVTHHEDVYVMLGVKVRRAFFGDARVCGFFETVRVAGPGVFISLPHPSGLSRPWNEPGARARARKLLGFHARWIPWGEDVEAGDPGVDSHLTNCLCNDCVEVRECRASSARPG